MTEAVPRAQGLGPLSVGLNLDAEYRFLGSDPGIPIYRSGMGPGSLHLHTCTHTHTHIHIYTSVIVVNLFDPRSYL